MTAEIVLVHIRSLAVGGDFVGEVVEVFREEDHDLLGITAFVPFAVPGDTVKVSVLERKSKYLKGVILESDSLGESRAEPLCAYYSDCGGCEMQHVTYEAQLKLKQQMIQGALRAGRLPSRVLETLKPIRESEPYHFRRRIQLHIDSSGRVGFYKPKSRTIVSIDRCVVAVQEVSELIPRAHEIAPIIKGKINSLTLESDGMNVLAVLTSPYTLSAKDQKEVTLAAKGAFKNFIIIAGGKEVAGSGINHLELPVNRSRSLFVSVPGGSFSQVNWDINLSLIERVCELLSITNDQEVYDLFAGAGNFTLPLARKGARVTAVECDPRLVFYGKESARKAGLERKISYHESSVEAFLKKQKKNKEGLTVIADPPRSGLGSLCEELSSVSRLVFIACHLPSFVRDIKTLTDKGFEVETIEPFDMFAQTSYVEILSVLSR